MNADFLRCSDSTYAIAGDLCFHTVSFISSKASKLISLQQEVVFDFEKLKHCDSAGIALLIQWKKLARQHNSQLKFINVTSQMQNLINLMGLNKVL